MFKVKFEALEKSIRVLEVLGICSEKEYEPFFSSIVKGLLLRLRLVCENLQFSFVSCSSGVYI